MKRVIIIAALMLSGTSLAHTSVKAVSPAAHASVTAPNNVEITFSEAIDLRFATFKVYPLTAQGDKLALNRAAAGLARTALKTRNDEAQRADQFRRQDGTAVKVLVPLKTKLTPGAYVFMWRVLSADGHIVSGQSVFTIR